MRIHRPNAAEVDLDAIAANTRIVKDLLGPARSLFAAVKGNGYGLGLPAVAEAMLAGGADGLTLSDPADAARIRRAGLTAPVLLYGGVLPSRETVAELRRLDLMCTVTDQDTAREFAAAAAGDGKAPLGVFAKIDVGLERLGTYAEQGLRFIRALTELPGLRLAGVYSHLHGSPNAAYRDWQLGRFDRLLEELDANGISVPLRMSESSASLGLQSAGRTNAADPGHLLYGIVPAGRPEVPDGLRPAFRGLVSHLIQVRDYRRAGFAAESPVPAGQVRRLGVIPIGRGDGLGRLTTGQVRVRGRLAPIVGRLSLEHARIDLTGVPGCRAGDEVQIIDSRPESPISPAAVAAASQLDQAGLLVAIGPAIPRVYLSSRPPARLTAPPHQVRERRCRAAAGAPGRGQTVVMRSRTAWAGRSALSRAISRRRAFTPLRSVSTTPSSSRSGPYPATPPNRAWRCSTPPAGQRVHTATMTPRRTSSVTAPTIPTGMAPVVMPWMTRPGAPSPATASKTSPDMPA